MQNFNGFLMVALLGVYLILVIQPDGSTGQPVPVEGTTGQSPAPVEGKTGNSLSPVGTPVPAGPTQDTSAQQPSPNVQGNGYITEHKSPDGSTLTITRFNGPLPPSAYPTNPFGYYPSPSVVQSWYESQLQSMALLYRNSWNYYLSHANNPYASLAYSNSLLANPPNNRLWYPGFQNQFVSSPAGQWPGAGGFAPPPQFFYPWPQQQLPATRANYFGSLQPQQS